LCQLEEFNKKYSTYPETLYLQVDGGMENANKFVLRLLEFLISRRILLTVWYSRLPVGHTHEDIDAVFGNIWCAARSDHCNTHSEFRERVHKSLGGPTLVRVEEIYVIPNYVDWLEPNIDKDLSLLHKEGNTQHQIRFTAVKPSEDFPLGVLTEYRGNCSDKVVEIEEKPKEQCISKMGQFTGLN